MRHGGDPETQTEPPPDVVRKILEAVRTVRYGSIEIAPQDARIVQIERKEKFRFDKPASD